MGYDSRLDRTHICHVTHICHACQQQCHCETYAWACPWLNDDEIQMCDPCTDQLAEDMYKEPE